MLPAKERIPGQSRVIVVDMGGTTTRLGLYSASGGLSGVVRFATPDPIHGEHSDSVRERHLDLIARAAEDLRTKFRASNEIGVAMGATVSDGGIVHNACMMWHEPCTGFNVAEAIGARLPWARVSVINDVAASAWRYHQLGRFAVITISTGVAVKVFDDALPPAHKLVLDDERLGGEMGHTLVDLDVFDSETAMLRVLGPAAARGDPTARTLLEQASLPWCECGTVADLCSYTSGPAVARAATARARANPQEWAVSALARLCGPRPEQVTTYALAEAAKAGDPFTRRVLSSSTRYLALRIAQLSADLGLRRVVITGGFAHGVGTPWFGALHDNLIRLPRHGGWFTGWTDDDLERLIYRPRDAQDDSLAGMGVYLDMRRMQVREVRKPIDEARTVVEIRSRPRVGREQFAAKILFAGICGTDLQILRGERGSEPGVLGHECVAEVVEVGGDVTEVRVGDVISLNPNNPFDEHEKIGHNQPGIFSELVIWDRHLAGRGQVIPLPSGGRAELVLLEPLACAVRTMRIITDRWERQRVLIVGAGTEGLLHLMLARMLQAHQVLLANRSGVRLHEAISRDFLQPEEALLLDGNLPLAIRRATHGKGVDVVIIAVSGGAGPAIVEDLWPCLADSATIHLFGGFPPNAIIHAPDGAVIDVAPIRGQARRYEVKLKAGGTCALTGSRGALREDFERAQDLCAGSPESQLALSPLITHIVSLDALPRVLSELASLGTINGEYALRAVVDLSLPGSVVRQTNSDRLPKLAGTR